MRLTSSQVENIKSTVNRVLNVPCRVWLFGSRVNDSLRGGDIDLLIETDAVIPDRALAICRVYGALIFALGDRKIDVLLKDANTQNTSVFNIAKRTGVIL